MYQLDLARSGETLFKIRGHYLTLVVLGGAAIAYFHPALGPFASDSANMVWFWVSLGVACAGALIRIITSGHAALGTSGNAKDAAIAAELNTTGPYSLVRNPLYTGRILNFTGLAMLSGSWVYGALVLLLSILIYERVSVYEEEFLRKTFGKAHAEWAKNVPFLLPRLHGWLKPKYPFWVRRCIRREEKKVLWLIIAVVLYDFARHGFSLDHVAAHPGLYYFMAATLLVKVILHGLRSFTKTFDGIA